MRHITTSFLFPLASLRAASSSFRTDAMAAEYVVQLGTPLVDRTQPLRHRFVLGLERSEAGAFHDRAVPVLRPDTVGLARSRGPGEHCRIEDDANRLAHPPQHRFR